MKFEQFYSSSKGNLYTVTAANGRRLLLECGVKWSDALKALNFKLDNIDACLLSHMHNDHSHAIENVMSCGIDVYSSAGTFEALEATGVAHSHRMKPVRAKQRFVIGDTFKVLPFQVEHDAADPFGYVIYEIASKKYLYWSMDTAYIEPDLYTIDEKTGKQIRIPFDIIALELSYEMALLQRQVDTGKIDQSLAKRLLTSHTEKQTAMSYLRQYCNLSQCRQIHLLHTSSSRLDRPQAVRDFTKKFCIKTFIKGIK